MSNRSTPLSADNNLLLTIANDYRTPCYVYDAKMIEHAFLAYQSAFSDRSHQICYAVKANSNLSVISLLAKLGAGFDIVSVGELKRVLMAGGDASKTIFSGVGKTVEEIAFALEAEIQAFDVESIAELENIIRVAQALEKKAPISIRFNPDVDAKTHPYISTGLKDNKFGLVAEDALKAYEIAKNSDHIKIVGINSHIGSQITDVSAFENALNNKVEFLKQLKSQLGITLKHINLGGGIGVDYEGEKTIVISDWVDRVKTKLPDNSIKIIMEPGRSIVAKSGVLLTSVLYEKTQSDNHFIIVDAAMNDYARVALYQSYNEITNLNGSAKSQPQLSHVVGPVCESSDFFAKNRNISAKSGDILAIHDVGAYGSVMASNYNTRELLPEVLVTGDDYQLIRKRQTFEEIIAGELIGDFELESID